MFSGHPAEREAERLRAIITALAEADPHMELGIASHIIFESEKKAAELERQQVETAMTFWLPNTRPETIAAFIALQSDIAALAGPKTINAIKEVRARAGCDGKPLSLKEAKDGVEFYNTHATMTPPVASTPAPPVPPASGSTLDWWADWINTQKTICDLYDDPRTGKIQAIKETRRITYLGLKEAKDAVEAWAARYR